MITVITKEKQDISSYKLASTMHPQPPFSSVVAASCRPSLGLSRRGFSALSLQGTHWGLRTSSYTAALCSALHSFPLHFLARVLSPTFLLRWELQLRRSPCPHLSPRSSEGPSRPGFGSNPCLLCAALGTVPFYLFSHFPRGFLGLCF